MMHRIFLLPVCPRFIYLKNGAVSLDGRAVTMTDGFSRVAAQPWPKSTAGFYFFLSQQLQMWSDATIYLRVQRRARFSARVAARSSGEPPACVYSICLTLWRQLSTY